MHPILHLRKPVTTASSCNQSLFFIALLLSFAGCTTAPGISPVEDRQIGVEAGPTSEAQPADDEEFSATPLEDHSYKIEQAEHYADLAANESAEAAADATLSAAEFYIQGNDSQTAEQTVLELNPQELTAVQLSRYQIIRAYAEYTRGENNAALARLQTILNQSVQLPEDQPLETRQQVVDALLLASLIYQNQGQHEAALISLLERESLLFGAARSETSRYIWQVIETIPVEHRQQMMATASNLQLRNRLEQSLTGRIGEQQLAPERFEQWRESEFESGSAVPASKSEWNELSPRSIAVLLPESSRYQRAAQAVKEGILYQHEINDSGYRPIINIYDIGQDPWQVSQFYAAAQQRGVDLVIGPLGKDYADSLLQSNAGGISTPTILLGGELALHGAAVRFDLNPEHESERIAEKAASRGYINAVVLAPTTSQGERMSRAFSEHWLQLGGKISKVVPYSPEQFDHSSEFRLMFELNQSEARHRALSDALGFKPKFTPYRRNDIDFIYLIADTQSGRIVRPQINFFGGNEMPVLAGSQIYNGIEDIAENMDLNNTTFPVMPWELTSKKVSPYAGQLNRLFALGSDAYQLAAELTQIRRDAKRVVSGNTGTLSIDSRGEVVIQPLWAVMREGIAQTDAELTPLEPDSDQIRLPRDNRAAGSQDRNNYNEQNWDPRQSRRKPGS